MKRMRGSPKNAMRLRFSPPSRIDLLEIGDYIADNNPRAARRIVRDLLARCRDVAARPLAFQAWDVRPALGLRRRVVGSYLIFYRVGADAVEITRIVHGARDLERIFGKDD
jgi:plasmid stabilization system protein ParE